MKCKLHDIIAINLPHFTIRVTDEEKTVMENYAKSVNKSVSEILRESFFNRFEDEYDVRLADESYSIYLTDLRKKHIDDVMKEYGLRTHLYRP